MTKRLVLLAGNIGAGKTSLTERIGERLGWKTAFESVADNPYLPDFYENMKEGKGMTQSKSFWYGNMAVVGLVWLYILYGFIFPFDKGMMNTIWLITSLVIIGTHILELPVSIPVGNSAEYPLIKTIVLTLLFGFIWWLPVKKGIFTTAKE